MNYYAFHIGDYKAHTSHLSLIEDLAFRRMLDLYYLTESPLPEIKKIARAICMRENIEDIQNVLDEFFIDTDEGFIHNRCEREIKAMNDKSGKAKLSAQKRWSKTDNANAMPESCEGNAPNPNPNPNKKQTTAIPNGFAEFWIAYPKKVGKGAAEAAWKKHRPSLQICLNAVAIASRSTDWTKDGGQYTPNPATWALKFSFKPSVPKQKSNKFSILCGTNAPCTSSPRIAS